MQHFGADASAIETLIRYAEKARQRGADVRRGNVVALQQQGLNGLAVLARHLHALRQLLCGEQSVGDQSVIAGGFAPRIHCCFLYALADRNGQCLAKLGDAIDFQLVEAALALVVDELQHALQHVAFQNRCHQHFTCHVAGALVDFFQKGQRRMNLLERLGVIDIGQIDQLLAERDVAGDALRRDRQLQFPIAFEARLDLGDNGATVFIDRVQCQALGVEQPADILAGIEHDLLKILGFMDARRDLLQSLVKKRLDCHILLRCGGLARISKTIRRFLQHRWFHHVIHRWNSWCIVEQRWSCTGSSSPK